MCLISAMSRGRWKNRATPRLKTQRARLAISPPTVVVHNHIKGGGKNNNNNGGNTSQYTTRATPLVNTEEGDGSGAGSGGGGKGGAGKGSKGPRKVAATHQNGKRFCSFYGKGHCNKGNKCTDMHMCAALKDNGKSCMARHGCSSCTSHKVPRS